MKIAAAALLGGLACPALACTQGESEDKVREAIYAMADLQQKNPAKAAAAKEKIDRALDESLQPASTTQARQAATAKLCKAMDEVLADLRR